ncbi:BQ5605_C018g08681 [Microbotryum silenes-dioicae]|uniref:BQ5605_C018g08681 protein n=1 Tax=Microbotryum silenes-dioicae TaxID=796604 RepID=A0A2X0NUJ7_9BASI|nr:BQ5605_C018g08681 [Microbotryum silenes-dioicae]
MVQPSSTVEQHLGAWLDKRQSLLPTWRAMIRCSLRQLALSNVKLRLEQLQIICQTHNLQGYSFRRSRARELFLRILLSSCTETCPACESGYIFKRSTAIDILVPRRHCVPRHTVYRHKTLESCQAELSKRRAATNNDSRADDDTRLRRTTQASQAERSSPYTPASARLQAEIRAEWNQYFTDAKFRVFCCLICSERVFGHEAHWVAESVLKCRDRGILEALTDVHLRSDLRPTTYDFEEWRAAIIDPRGLHRRNDLEGQPIYFATDEFSVQLVTARARAYKIVYKITKFGDPNAQQKCTRGNTLIFSQNTAAFTDILPMSVEQLADSVCVLFCGAEANLTQLDSCRPMIVRQGKVKRMLKWLSHVCGFSREHLPPERQQPQHLIRKIGLELVTSEALATQGMESELRCLFSEHAATAWNLGSGQSIEVNMPNLTTKPQVVFTHHQLIIPKV